MNSHRILTGLSYFVTYFFSKMQSYIHNCLFDPRNIRYVEVNNFYNPVTNKKLVSALRNAYGLLIDLEHSLRKTKKYEKRLVHCKATHSFVHDLNDSCSSDSDEKYSKVTTNSCRHNVELTETWSTMSIICLQYQYEELAKRYKNLLQAYEDKCLTLMSCDAALKRLQRRAATAQKRLINANKAVLAVGEKYLTLRCQKHLQRGWYQRKIEQLKSAVRTSLATSETVLLELDDHLNGQMSDECDQMSAVLLTEIKKCNQLCLENLELKSQIENLRSKDDASELHKMKE